MSLIRDGDEVDGDFTKGETTALGTKDQEEVDDNDSDIKGTWLQIESTKADLDES